jgi:hypothetical protein
MDTKAQNILQFEFFNVNIETNSLGRVVQECLDRISDSQEATVMGMELATGMKTVIRVHDLDLTVTKYAQKIQKLERERNNQYTKTSATFIGRFLDMRRLSRNRKSIESLKTKIRAYVSAYVTQALRTKSVVAHSELYELGAAIQNKDFWLFVFKPNDLLSDKNETVVSIM